TWPTACLSAPLTTTSVWEGHSILIPLGISCRTSCEKPSCSFRVLPWTWARKPTPTRFRRRSKPALTPVTMLFTSARTVPDMALAWRESLAAAKVSWPSSWEIRTLPSRDWVRVPSGPLTTICPALMVASTPFGSATGYLAMRDMVEISLCHVAEHFATDAVGAGLAVRHDATGGRDDRHAQAVHDLGNGIAALVDTQAGTRDAVDALDHRTAGIIFQDDFQLRLGLFATDTEILDVAFVLQHGGNGRLQLGGGHGNRRLVDHLRIAHAGQHIGDGIAHAHVCFSYQLALVMPGTSPRMAISRSLWRVSPNLLNTPRGRPVTTQRLRWRGGLALRGSCCSARRA